MRLIDADALIEDVDGDLTDSIAEGRAIEKIINAPTIEPEQKKGKWIATHESTLFSHPDSVTYVCSECGYKIYTVYGLPPIPNFCQTCGADMRDSE